MSDILIRPPVLRQTAGQLRQRARAVQAAVQAVDQQVSALSARSFEGTRSNTFRTRYRAKREAMLKFHEMIIRLATDLDQAADRFEMADRQTNPPAVGGLPGIVDPAPYTPFEKFAQLGIPIDKTDPAVQKALESLLPFTGQGNSERATFQLSGEVGLPGIEVGIPGSPKVIGASGMTIERNANGTYTLTINSEGGLGLHEPLAEASGKVTFGNKTYGAGVDASVDILAKGGASMNYTFDPSKPGEMTEMAALVGKYGVDALTAGMAPPAKQLVGFAAQALAPSPSDLQDNLSGVTLNLGPEVSGEASLSVIVELAGVDGKLNPSGIYQLERGDNGHWLELSGVEVSGEGSFGTIKDGDFGGQGEITVTKVVDLTTGVESARVHVQFTAEPGGELKVGEVEKLIGFSGEGIGKMGVEGGLHGLVGMEVEYQIDQPADTVKNMFSSGSLEEGLNTLGAQSHVTVDGIVGAEFGLGAEVHLGAVSQGVDLGAGVEVSRETVIPLWEYQPL